MARQSKPIVAEAVSGKTTMQLSIFNECWIVLYDGKPARIRYRQVSGSNKYKPLYFTEKARAENRCKTLNKEFNTDKFSVKEFVFI